MTEQGGADGPVPAKVCNQPWNTFYVPAKGEAIQPCCFGSSDLGSLGKSSLEEIWNGPGFVECRQRLLENRPQGICVACVRGERNYADHITPFVRGLRKWLIFNRQKRKNLGRAVQSFRQKKLVVDAMPYLIYLDVSSTCRLRCRKCYVNRELTPLETGHMTLETFEKVTPALPYALKVICTGVGESVLSPHFMHIVRTIRKHECKVSFTTSGNPLTPEMCEELVEIGTTEIVFSIDSLNEKRYLYQHRGGDINKVMHNLETISRKKKQLRSRLPVLGWFFVPLKSNLDELPLMIQKAAELGFRSVYGSELLPAEQWNNKAYIDFYQQENLISTEEDIEHVRRVLDASHRLAADLKIRFTAAFDVTLAAHAANLRAAKAA